MVTRLEQTVADRLCGAAAWLLTLANNIGMRDWRRTRQRIP
jgi:hypothetical protein